MTVATHWILAQPKQLGGWFLTISALPVTGQSIDSNGGATQGTIQAVISITYTYSEPEEMIVMKRVITLFAVLLMAGR